MEFWSTNILSSKEEAMEQIEKCEKMNGAPLGIVEESETVLYAKWTNGGAR